MTYKWEHFDACPVCGDKHWQYFGTATAPVFQFENVLGGVPMAVLSAYVTCQGCGLIYQPDHLSADSMIEFYASGLYRSSLSRPQSELDASEKVTAERIAPVIPIGSHLDVGCSRGYLLAETQKRGCKVFGVEPYADYVTEDVQTCRSIDDVQGLWDTITCIHVFEHTLDPLTMARKLIDLLKPGGYLMLEVPSDQSPGGWMRLAHTFCFNPWVIRRIFAELELTNFQVMPHNYFVFQKR